MSLDGKTVLLLEDDPLLSADLALLLEDAGAEVIGPFRTFHEGLATVEAGLPHAALLDVELLDGKSFPVADRLHDGACRSCSTPPRAPAGTRRRRPAMRRS